MGAGNSANHDTNHDTLTTDVLARWWFWTPHTVRRARDLRFRPSDHFVTLTIVGSVVPNTDCPNIDPDMDSFQCPSCGHDVEQSTGRIYNVPDAV
jgi:hypothetical protein